MMLLAIAAAGCVALSGANITARDLAHAVPAFTPADPDAVVGYSPAPGVQRIMRAPELRQTLEHLGFTGDAVLEDSCFQRPVSPVSVDAAVQAMRHTLGLEAQIEVIEMSKFAAPAGEVVFPREGIGSSAEAIWHGYVRYDVVKKFPIWARVKLSVRSVHVIAAEELKPGEPIRASQLRVEAIDEFPQKRITPRSIEEAAGCVPRRFIAANAPVWTDALNPRNDITKGDRVTVMVESGLARLSFDAQADAAGRTGDLISFKNPESGKLFRARVEGPGRASVETPAVRE